MKLKENILVFDDIIDFNEQQTLLNFFKNSHTNWSWQEKNITTGIDDIINEYHFPGWSTNVDQKNIKFKIDENIFNIIQKIERVAIEKANLKFIKNYRYKLNCLPPIEKQPPLNELYKNVHTDADIDHIVLLYYANDTDGDTLVFKNKLGISANNNMLVEKQAQSGDFSNIELLKCISPKMGRVVVFDGQLLHCAGWSLKDKRFVANFNTVVKTEKVGLI